MKTCNKCGETKDVSAFGKDKSRSDGLDHRCRSCKSTYAATYSPAYHLANKERIKAKTAKWSAENSEKRRINEHTRRARKREITGKLSTSISEKLFKLQQGKCACGCKQPLGDGFHLDHIMPLALGGSNTDDNVQLLTATCNQQKHKKHPIDFMQQRGFLL